MATSLTLRAAKGSALTFQEVDDNFSNLKTTADAALPSASFSGANVLSLLLAVDGAGSGLDADLLDGIEGAAYATVASLSAYAALADDETITGNWSFDNEITVDGSLMIGLGGASDSNSVAIGSLALQGGTAGTFSVAIGSDALRLSSGGSGNVGVGEGALRNQTTGLNNLGLGRRAGYRVGTASGNVMIGATAGFGSGASYGDFNIGIGSAALNDIAAGTGNIAIGNETLDLVTTGDYNIAVGFRAGDAITTGNNNTIFGRYSGTAALADTLMIYAGTAERIFADGTDARVNGNIMPQKVAVPATATDTAAEGSIAADGSWLYIAIADNDWRRVALSTF